jgi:hypothetical protein
MGDEKVKVTNPQTLLAVLAQCGKGKGLPLDPRRTKGYRYCMTQGWIERLGVPGILEVTRLTPAGRRAAKVYGATLSTRGKDE